MPQYLYQLAYTPESLAAQMKNPQDRLEVVGKQLTESAGVKIVAGGDSFGEYDVAVIVEAADDTTMAAGGLPHPGRRGLQGGQNTPPLCGAPVGGALPKG